MIDYQKWEKLPKLPNKYLRRNVPRQKSRTAKCPTAKCPYVELSSRRNIPRQNIPRRKVLRRTFLEPRKNVTKSRPLCKKPSRTGNNEIKFGTVEYIVLFNFGERKSTKKNSLPSVNYWSDPPASSNLLAYVPSLHRECQLCWKQFDEKQKNTYNKGISTSIQPGLLRILYTYIYIYICIYIYIHKLIYIYVYIHFS